MPLKKLLHQTNTRLAVSESLTGGLLSATIVNTSGISSFYQGGVTTYSLQSKEDILHVPLSHTTSTDGVDGHTAEMMAKGTTVLFQSDVAIATTGIAERWDNREEQAFVALYDARSQEVLVNHLLFGDELQQQKIPAAQVRSFVRARVTKYCLEMLFQHLERLALPQE